MAEATTGSDEPRAVLAVVGGGAPARVLVGPALDRSTASAVRDVILSVVRTAGDAVVVDLSQTEVIDKVGLRALVACRRRAAAAGVEMVLDRPAPGVAGVLEFCGLGRSFRVAGGHAPARPAGVRRRRSG